MHSVTVRNISSIKSHLIKAIHTALKKISWQQLHFQYRLHPPLLNTEKYSPLNAPNDLENLLQVHAFTKKKKKRKRKRASRGEKKKSGFGQVVLASSAAPRGVYFILTVNQCYRTYQIMHLSLNFTFAFKSGEGNEHCWLKIRAPGRQ